MATKSNTEKANPVAKPLAQGDPSEAIAEPGEGGGWATPAGQQTPTQIQTEGKANITSDSEGRDQKIIYSGRLGGEVPAGERTTIKEEVVELSADKIPSGDVADNSDLIRNMRVLAHSQGINQIAKLGSKNTEDGKAGEEILTVFMDGHHTTEVVPVDQNPSDEKKAAAKKG